MTEYLQLGFGIAIVVGGLISNTKLIGFHINKALKPTNIAMKEMLTIQKEHGVMLEIHNKHLSRYSTNESFYKSIEETIEEALKYFEEDQAASRYIDVVGRNVIDFSKEILLAGINNIADKIVQTKAKRYIAELTNLNLCLFGEKFSTKYFKKYSYVTKKYTRDICSISDDNVNDKTKRFRSITMVYIETVGSNFANFYLNNRGILKSKTNV